MEDASKRGPIAVFFVIGFRMSVSSRSDLLEIAPGKRGFVGGKMATGSTRA
jgi:hypothetical protein